MIVEVKDKTMNTHPHTQSNQQTPRDDGIEDGSRKNLYIHYYTKQLQRIKIK